MKKLSVLILLLTICFFEAHSQSERTVVYIEQYKAIAIQEMKRTGIPASITLAQGILESNSGESDLAKKSNNHFGIKCKSDWKGETTYQDDDSKQECFRVYPTVKASYTDHSNFLKNRPNYAPLFLLDPVDDSAWAFGLKKAGYATASDYPKKLLKVIDDYELSQYNFPELDGEEEEAAKAASDVKKIDDSDVKKIDTVIELNKPRGIDFKTTTSNTTAPPVMKGVGPVQFKVASTEKATETPASTLPVKKVINYPSGKFRVNQVPAIWATSGSSYLEIVAQYKIPLYKIFEYNEIEEADIVETDRLLFLAPKKKYSHKTIHIVTPGETLYDISQTEGIQLKYLKEYNSINSNKKLNTGDVILLFKKQNNPLTNK